MEKENLNYRAETILRSTLSEISFLEILEILKNFQQKKVRADFWVKLRSSSGLQDIVVEVKKKGEPRFIRDVVNQLIRYLEFIPNAYGVIIAPYISCKSAQICKDSNIGYLDFSGNCFMNFQQVHIEKEGKPNYQSEKRLLKSLFYPKAERVLRVLLNNPNNIWKMQSLANEAAVSLGMSSKIKKRLEENEMVKTEPNGFRLSEWNELLTEWGNNYSYKKNQIHNFYTKTEAAKMELELNYYCKENKLQFALTSFSGASRVAPYTRIKRVFAYVERDLDKLIDILDLQPVPSGSNVTLFIPYDDGVFYNYKLYDGLKVVSPIQLYLDLKSYGGRGEDAAQFLFEKVIKIQWSQEQIMDIVK